MKKTIISFVAILMLFPLISIAASNIAATVTTSKTSLKPGDTVVVSVSITNIDQASLGIASFKGVLEYDKSVFEEISMSSFENKNEWNISEYNTNNGQFTVLNSGMVKTNQEMFSVTLKAKENATVGSTIINIKDLMASDTINDIVLSNRSVSVNVLASVPNSNNNKDVIISNGNTVENNISNNVVNNLTNKIESNTTATTNLPKAGLQDFTLVAFVIAVISSVVYYAMYKRIK